MVSFIYMHVLNLSLAITDFSRKNGLVISYMIRKITGPENAKGSKIGRATRLRIRLILRPAIKPKSIRKFFIGPATGSAGAKRLSSS